MNDINYDIWLLLIISDFFFRLVLVIQLLGPTQKARGATHLM